MLWRYYHVLKAPVSPVSSIVRTFVTNEQDPLIFRRKCALALGKFGDRFKMLTAEFLRLIPITTSCQHEEISRRHFSPNFLLPLRRFRTFNIDWNHRIWPQDDSPAIENLPKQKGHCKLQQPHKSWHRIALFHPIDPQLRSKMSFMPDAPNICCPSHNFSSRIVTNKDKKL